MEPMKLPTFEIGSRELCFGIGICILTLFGVDSVLFGGFHLGFSIASVLLVALNWAYLQKYSKKSRYGTALLTLSAVIGASFVRSNDEFVKFVMFCFLLVAENLGYGVYTGRTQQPTGSFASLADALAVLFDHGLLGTSAAGRGLKQAWSESKGKSKKGSAILAGLAISLPLAAVLIALLVSADAAFEGLIALLPEIDLSEPVVVLMLSCLAAPVLFARPLSLVQSEKKERMPGKKLQANVLTVNTVLSMVCFIFALYLVSQLAYFTDAFRGILPEEFTLAQYARRGFFEMAVLCGLNLVIIGICVGLTRPVDGTAPTVTRWLCLMVGLVTLVFVVSSSAKMALYIASFGLTRLRVLTEVITLFFGLATVMVCIWVFRPKFGYMRAVILTALIMGALVAWADVDTVVAAYNVRAYRSGVLKSVDVQYLGSLSDGAIPYIEELTKDENQTVANQAKDVLKYREYKPEDFRGWYLTAGK